MAKVTMALTAWTATIGVAIPLAAVLLWSNQRAVEIPRMLTFFTIQSSLLTAATFHCLYRNPAWLAKSGWSLLYLVSVSGSVVTGMGNAIWLRADFADGIDPLTIATWALHTLVPIFALLTWLLRPHPTPFGAWGRAPVLAWPMLWLGWVFAYGHRTGWYPYSFLDPSTRTAHDLTVGILSIPALAVLALCITAGIERLVRRADDTDGATPPG